MPQTQGKISRPGIKPQDLREGKEIIGAPDLTVKKEKELIGDDHEKEQEEKKDDFSGEEGEEVFLEDIPQVSTPYASHSSKSETLTKVEKILEKDLGDIYFKMPPEAKRNFKIKGEEISLKINEMIEAGKVIARKILALIKSWLQTIPGVNRFFLEQEAKIKTDKIMDYVEREKKNIDI